MTKPVLPACSVQGCVQCAGAVINGELLCGEHAVAILDRWKQEAAMKEQYGIDGSH